MRHSVRVNPTACPLLLSFVAMDQPRHRPFVPENMKMPEFTLRAVLLGLVMTIVLGAANAYLGLRAGITIAATPYRRRAEARCADVGDWQVRLFVG